MTDEPKNQLTDILNQLSPNQIRFVVSRLDYDSDAAAARALDLDPTTVSKWPERELIRRALSLVALDSISGIKAVIERNGVKAALVKVKGLDSEDESIRQRAALEIINLLIGDAKKTIDLTSGGQKIIISLKQPDEQ